jgi:hypothetical protein
MMPHRPGAGNTGAALRAFHLYLDFLDAYTPISRSAVVSACASGRQ